MDEHGDITWVDTRYKLSSEIAYWKVRCEEGFSTTFDVGYSIDIKFK